MHDDYSDAQTKLGDFHDGSNAAGTDDYLYDSNGNLVKDLNKNIGSSGSNGITYNHLNLPTGIAVKNSDGSDKGSIEYVYDATGAKLKKIVHESGKADKTTLYMGGFVYEDNVLQFIGQEEGRIRIKQGATSTFDYDYFIKDH